PATAAPVEQVVEIEEPVVIVVLPEAVGPRAAAVSVPVGEGQATASSDALEAAPASSREAGQAEGSPVMAGASSDNGAKGNGRGSGRSNGRSNGATNGKANGAANDKGNGTPKASADGGPGNGAAKAANGAARKGRTTGAEQPPAEVEATNGDRPSKTHPIG